MDDYHREGTAIEAGFSLPAVRVIRVLAQLLEWRTKLLMIRCDNGSYTIPGIRVPYIFFMLLITSGESLLHGSLIYVYSRNVGSTYNCCFEKNNPLNKSVSN